MKIPFFSQPLDRVALTLMLVLGALMGLLVLGGNHTAPKVRDFSWQNKQVGAEDAAFLITFSRPMSHESVEQNLVLTPELPGRFSWAGRRMAYTLNDPAPYGTAFQLKLQGARDRFSNEADNNPIQPFVGNFRTRDRAFVYLGVEGDETGRLVLENLTQKTHTILTPSNLLVMDFKAYPHGDRILFSASEQQGADQAILNQQLYTVTTGIYSPSPADSPTVVSQRQRQRLDTAQPSGIVTLVLDGKDYQNLKFDLSPDGGTIAIQRVNRQDPSDFGLWIITADHPPQPIKTEPGGDFMIAPDSKSLAMAQGQGLAILPIESDAEPLDFLPKFGMILNFAKDGTAAAMVRFNEDPLNPTRSLYLVSSQGGEKELLQVTGSILAAQFDPQKQTIYCLATELLPGEDYIEQPFLTAINLETTERTDLLILPIQRDIQMSLAPDKLGILFDQLIADAADQSGDGGLRSSDGKAIATSRLWFLPLLTDEAGSPIKAEPEQLPVAGLRPRWLP